MKRERDKESERGREYRMERRRNRASRDMNDESCTLPPARIKSGEYSS